MVLLNFMYLPHYPQYFLNGYTTFFDKKAFVKMQKLVSPEQQDNYVYQLHF